VAWQSSKRRDATHLARLGVAVAVAHSLLRDEAECAMSPWRKLPRRAGAQPAFVRRAHDPMIAAAVSIRAAMDNQPAG
jgi:hypothetical protein